MNPVVRLEGLFEKLNEDHVLRYLKKFMMLYVLRVVITAVSSITHLQYSHFSVIQCPIGFQGLHRSSREIRVL